MKEAKALFNPSDLVSACASFIFDRSFAAAPWLNEYTQSKTADDAFTTRLALFVLASSQVAGSKCYSFLRRFVDPSISFMPPRRLLYFSRMPSSRAHSESRLDVSWSARCVYFVLQICSCKQH